MDQRVNTNGRAWDPVMAGIALSAMALAGAAVVWSVLLPVAPAMMC